MDYLSKFSIPFVNLPLGIHKYEFDVENKFFESFENSIVQKAAVHVNLTLDRQETMLLLNFEFKGSIELECDRCLGKFDYAVDKNYHMITKIEEVAADKTEDDVITISSAEHSIHLAQHLYDYISLMIPYRRVHPDDENGESNCDPEILKKIEGLSHHEENHNDPRWEALKKLKK